MLFEASKFLDEPKYESLPLKNRGIPGKLL